jgi:hypothetical protein
MDIRCHIAEYPERPGLAYSLPQEKPNRGLSCEASPPFRAGLGQRFLTDIIEFVKLSGEILGNEGCLAKNLAWRD